VPLFAVGCASSEQSRCQLGLAELGVKPAAIIAAHALIAYSVIGRAQRVSFS
jgi:hypothetical protein